MRCLNGGIDGGIRDGHISFSLSPDMVWRPSSGPNFDCIFIGARSAISVTDVYPVQGATYSITGIRWKWTTVGTSCHVLIVTAFVVTCCLQLSLGLSEGMTLSTLPALVTEQAGGEVEVHSPQAEQQLSHNKSLHWILDST